MLNSSYQNTAPSSSYNTSDQLQFYSEGVPEDDKYYQTAQGSLSHGTPPSGYATYSSSDDDFSNEPPLLEELGINFQHIWVKTIDVLLPSRISRDSMNDTDLAGPLIYCLFLGFSLLLAGKLHFGYIYGFGIVGCLSLYTVLNLMSKVDLDIHRIVSIFGYCLLPIVGLSLIGIVLNLKQSFIGQILSILAVVWCTIAATRFVEMVFGMRAQRYLVAYPILLLYSCFAMLTIF